MGLHDEKLSFEEPPAPLPERQRTAFGIMIEGLGGDRAIDIYNAGGPADLVAAHRNHPLEQRHTAGQDAMVREALSRVAEGRTTTIPPTAIACLRRGTLRAATMVREELFEGCG